MFTLRVFSGVQEIYLTIIDEVIKFIETNTKEKPTGLFKTITLHHF